MAIATGVLTFVVLVFAEVCQKPLPRCTRKKSLIRVVFCGSAANFDDAAGLVAECYYPQLMRMMGIKTDIVVSGSLSKENYAPLCTNRGHKFPVAIRIAAVGTRSGKDDRR